MMEGKQRELEDGENARPAGKVLQAKNYWAGGTLKGLAPSALGVVRNTQQTLSRDLMQESKAHQFWRRLGC